MFALHPACNGQLLPAAEHLAAAGCSKLAQLTTRMSHAGKVHGCSSGGMLLKEMLSSFKGQPAA